MHCDSEEQHKAKPDVLNDSCTNEGTRDIKQAGLWGPGTGKRGTETYLSLLAGKQENVQMKTYFAWWWGIGLGGLGHWEGGRCSQKR